MRAYPAREIAVIGGGAKAAAIAAKAECLRELLDLDVNVTIFERAEIGALWTGRHGFTDGAQLLCTPAERDLGFPYAGGFLSPVLHDRMQARFSWQAFAVAENHYPDWVDAGRPPPGHGVFAAYLKFAVQRSGAAVRAGEVTALLPRGARWDVAFLPEAGAVPQVMGPFDGVVITGTGPALRRVAAVADPRVLDGVTFWRELGQVPALAAASDDPVVIIGSGGTAAAAAAWLARNLRGKPVVLVGPHAALHARTDSFFENMAFRDSEVWRALGPVNRARFTDRLLRGAVWESVLDVLAAAPGLTYQPGRALRIEHVADPGPPPGLQVVFSRDGEAPGPRLVVPACMVVDATGFDDWWFLNLLPLGLRRHLVGSALPARPGEVSRLQRRRQAAMRETLELPLGRALRLHVPMLSQEVAPGYGSLMVLGAMADAVLAAYVPAALGA